MKSEEEVRSNIELFRSRASSAGFFFLSFIFVGMVFQSITSSGPKQIAFTIAWATFAITTFHALMHKPKIEIFDEGLEVVNPISRHTFPWSDIRSIDTRFSLSVVTNDLRGLKLGMTGNIKAGESPKSDSGAAYLLTSARFENFKARPASLNQSTSAKIKREWSSAVIAVVAIIALIALR